MIAIYLPRPESLNIWLWNSFTTEGASERVSGGEVKALSAEDAKAEVAEASGTNNVVQFDMGS